MENKEYHANLGDEIEGILKGVQAEGINSLKDIIKDIEDLIEKRKALSAEIFLDLEKVKINVDSFHAQKSKEMTIAEVLEVKKKELEIEEAKIKEKIDCFKDIANLKRELRIHIADFRDRVSKANMLDDLIKQ